MNNSPLFISSLQSALKRDKCSGAPVPDWTLLQGECWGAGCQSKSFYRWRVARFLSFSFLSYVLSCHFFSHSISCYFASYVVLFPFLSFPFCLISFPFLFYVFSFLYPTYIVSSYLILFCFFTFSFLLSFFPRPFPVISFPMSFPFLSFPLLSSPDMSRDWCKKRLHVLYIQWCTLNSPYLCSSFSC